MIGDTAPSVDAKPTPVYFVGNARRMPAALRAAIAAELSQVKVAGAQGITVTDWQIIRAPQGDHNGK